MLTFECRPLEPTPEEEKKGMSQQSSPSQVGPESSAQRRAGEL
jgi:hypothetical protein